MPALTGAKDERTAIERHRARIQQSLATVTVSGTWQPIHRPDGSYALITAPEAVELSAVSRSTGEPVILFLHCRQSFVVVKPTALRGFKVQTTSYSYAISLTDSINDARIAWHWHPDLGRLTAHVHAYFQDEMLGKTERMHLPTSRVLFEQIVRFLIEDMEVQTTRADWSAVLDQVQQGVEAAATWHGEAPSRRS